LEILLLLSYPVIFADDGFGTVFALCPDIPEAMTYAPTREEAAAKSREALQGAFDLYRIEGRPIPRPSKIKGDIVVSLLTQDLGFEPVSQGASTPASPKRAGRSAGQRLQRLFSLKRLYANVES
jgi:antitoxin HicB